MKKQLVETTSPPKCKKMGWWVMVQMVKDVLILNIFNNRLLQSRHCINVVNYEFATLRNSQWFKRRIEEALKINPWYGYCYDTQKVKERMKMSEEDKKLILDALKATDYPVCFRTPYDLIDRIETEYGRKKRETTENNRMARVNALMSRIPPAPDDLQEWINQREIGGEDYATKTERKGIYACSACGEKFSDSKLKRVDGEPKVRHNDMVICPACGKHIKLIRRSKSIDILTHFALVQPIDENISVIRHFDAVILCKGDKKQIGLDEAVRIVMFKNNHSKNCELYYNQWYCGWNWVHKSEEQPVFDNKSNRANRSEYDGYLYDAGVAEAFKGTRYERWSRLFSQMAAAGVRADYNRLMCSSEGQNFVDMIEMLFRNRFYKLLLEASEDVGIWSGAYCGILRITGSSIEDVFKIGDRQKINRIRDNDGDGEMVQWMRWSEMRNKKIPDKVLNWLLANGIDSSMIGWLSCKMSVEQMMNYIERQRKESYKEKNVRQVINQYEDYMHMCQKLEKDITDEMVYRPRELRRRHDEAVAEMALREAELKADEYSRRFPGAEDVMKEIKPRYDYENEEYLIYVPQRLVEIVAEGRALHHCAGSSDRYFDRIMQRETYICLLRKKSEPETPYYTIEVEPGGTIRQHRGYLDEEPEIELVKPFLREWQKEIKKRMTENDRIYAEISAVKREENIAELKAKNNTRVLEGLMEDFMEAAI